MHPESVSIPMTCTQRKTFSMKPHNDWMFYVLYHDDAFFMKGIIQSSVQHLRQCQCGCDHSDLQETLDWFLDTTQDSIDKLRVKLFLLLDRDEKTRKEFTVFQSGTCHLRAPFPVEKANRFYPDLHDVIIPNWMPNESLSCRDLVNDIRMGYLIS